MGKLPDAKRSVSRSAGAVDAAQQAADGLHGRQPGVFPRRRAGL